MARSVYPQDPSMVYLLTFYHKNQPFMYGTYTIPMNPYGYRSLYIETLQVVSCHATNFQKWKFLSDDDEPSYYPLLETNSEKQTTNLRCTNPNTKPPHQKKVSDEKKNNSYFPLYCLFNRERLIIGLSYNPSITG